MTRLAVLTLLGLATTAVAPGALIAQTDSLPDLDRLKAAAQAHPDSFPVVFAYARALARETGEEGADWRARQAARKALDAVYRMRPEDPKVLVEIGLLMRKQGFRTDAKRILERAERRANDAGSGLAPRERAELQYSLGLIYETWWEDFEHLGLLVGSFAVGSCSRLDNMTPGGEMATSSARASLLAYNVACPDVFDALMARWYPLGDGESERENMLRHFEAAVDADPTQRHAALRLLRHLAAAGRWDEFLATAGRFARANPADPYALMFLGLGHHLAGRREQADSAFALAIAYADPDLRHDMLQPAQLLRSQDSTSFLRLAGDRQDVVTDAFWRARDPLFLSPENERLAEHLARLAYVEVAYAQPQSGVRGRWSERGAAWLRWGRPLQIRAIRAADSRLLEFWDYGAGAPDLVFERVRTYRRARYEELSGEYVRYAREYAPELYVSEHPRFVAEVPFQAAAFRDTVATARLEVYAAVPAGALREVADLRTVEAGVFVVTGDYWEPRDARLRTVDSAVAWAPLDVAFPLAPGRYVVSAEATAGDAAARLRERVEVPAFGDSLMLSDLLLVNRFGADTAQVDDRAALRPDVARSLAFTAGTPIGVVWEIYGLTTDATGAAAYRVRAEVTDGDQRDAYVRLRDRLFREGGTLAGVGWEVRRIPRRDGVVVEFVSLELPDAKPGPYRLLITVTDALTGRSWTAHRLLQIVEQP